MENIQNRAMQTYQQNIEYLKEKHPKTVQLLTILDQAIANGDYQERYALEYINDGFDVQDLQTGDYLYKKESARIANSLAEKVNYDKNDSIIEGLPVLYIPKKENYSDKEMGRFGLFPIMRYSIEHTFRAGLHFMKEIKKYFFLGTVLGLHIPLIHQKIKANNYLIIEDNLEFFKLSLFTTDYASLAKEANLYFSIAASKEEFVDTFTSYIIDSSFDNRFLKYTHLGIHSDEKIKYMQLVVSTQGYHTFPYRTVLNKAIHPLKYINDGTYILKLNKELKNSPFQSKPVLLLGAGPSLHKNIEWLKENQDKFLIISVTSALQTLYKNDIVPDILTHLDGFDASLIHFNNIPKEFFKNTLAIFGMFAPLEAREKFPKENIFTLIGITGYFQDMVELPFRCVGSFTLNIAVKLNAQNLYLLGLDLALDQESGSTHSPQHMANKKLDVTNLKNDKVMDLKKNLQKVEGNFRDEVLTVSEFNQSIELINQYIPEAKNATQNIYNLNDGAKFTATTPLKIEKIPKQPTIDKKESIDELRTALQINSVTHLNDEEIELLKERLKRAQNVKTIIDKYAKQNYSSSEAFLYELITLYMNLFDIKNHEAYDIVIIFVNYFEYLIPIVVDFFNTQGLKNKKRDIKKLNQIIIKELYDIQTIYESALSEFLSTKI